MNIISAVDKNWAIGKNNALLVNIPSDMKLFRQLTMNGIVIMGHKTLETLQNGQPLMNRVNLVLSKDKNLKIKNAYVLHSVEDVMDFLESLYEQGYSEEDVFVIGGASVYKQFLPYCKLAYITKIDHAYEADSYFPNLDEAFDWQLTEQSEEQTYFDLEYAFLKYRKR